MKPIPQPPRLSTADAEPWMLEGTSCCAECGHRSGFRCIPLKEPCHMLHLRHWCETYRKRR